MKSKPLLHKVISLTMIAFVFYLGCIYSSITYGDDEGLHTSSGQESSFVLQKSSSSRQESSSSRQESSSSQQESSSSQQESRSTRIVGGIEAQPRAWPFMGVLLPSYSNDPYRDFHCGVSLISSSWAMTAAHCVTDEDGSFDPDQNLDVIIGIHNITKRQGERIHVSEIILNDDYDPFLTDGDIALLRLERPSKAIPVALIGQSRNAPLITSGDSTVIGWGATQKNGYGYTEYLLQVSLPVVSNLECQKAENKNGYGSTITNNMICAGFIEGGKDSCSGDSGGPLMIFENNQWTQVGIVSWGTGCAEPGLYGVYTRVSRYRDWIDQYADTATDTDQDTTTTTYMVLTDNSTYTVQSGSTALIYGCKGENSIILESGANAKLMNVPGSNTITIESRSDLFSVSRSGATVTFQGTDGTILSIPATTTAQSIVFNDKELDLIIDSGNVKLDKQVINTTPSLIF